MSADKNRDICLDCFWMHHSNYDWYKGRCIKNGDEITYINNYSTCQDFMPFDAFEEEMEDYLEEGSDDSYIDENGYLVDDYTDPDVV